MKVEQKSPKGLASCCLSYLISCHSQFTHWLQPPGQALNTCLLPFQSLCTYCAHPHLEFPHPRTLTQFISSFHATFCQRNTSQRGCQMPHPESNLCCSVPLLCVSLYSSHYLLHWISMYAFCIWCISFHQHYQHHKTGNCPSVSWRYSFPDR